MSEESKPFPHRQFRARARPMQRGPVRCLYPDCEATFKNEWACTQHRIAVHNEGTPISSADKLPCEMCAGSKWKSVCPECDGTGFYTPDASSISSTNYESGK